MCPVMWNKTATETCTFQTAQPRALQLGILQTMMRVDARNKIATKRQLKPLVRDNYSEHVASSWGCHQDDKIKWRVSNPPYSAYSPQDPTRFGSTMWNILTHVLQAFWIRKIKHSEIICTGPLQVPSHCEYPVENKTNKETKQKRKSHTEM